MDQRARLSVPRRPPIGRPPRRHPVFHAVLSTLSATLAFVAFIPGAQGPAYGTVNPAPLETASLTYSGTDVIITGSVDQMFKTAGTFVGPNRAEKQNRARIVPDALEFTSGFTEARLQLASLRATAFDDAAAPVVATAAAPVPPQRPEQAGTPLVVAALAPAPTSSALSAIEAAVPAPVPLVLSDELAYARADAPLTTFDGSALDSSGKKVSAKELWCLSQAIYFEARGESYRGQVAVAQVVLNRLKHRLYPKTICGVVFQNEHMRNACQFSFACDGIAERVTDAKSWKQAEEIAKGAVAGDLYVQEVGQATHYHATYVYPDWAPRMKKVTKIGMHVFYQFKRNWRYG